MLEYYALLKLVRIVIKGDSTKLMNFSNSSFPAKINEGPEYFQSLQTFAFVKNSFELNRPEKCLFN